AGVVLCSHLLAEVEQVCDDVVILSSGTIVASGLVSDVIGHAEQNAVRVRVPGASADAALAALSALPVVVSVKQMEGDAGWLRVEIDGANGKDGVNNQILDGLIRGNIPVLSFEPQSGRLQDVFLHLTAEGIK
ncbi:MAG TPA: hypothetical protein VJ816_02425, partial [Gemmatimonadales bacterium]|nr:hypothetical protein [Gemmatimonadales bacterium]